MAAIRRAGIGRIEADPARPADPQLCPGMGDARLIGQRPGDGRHQRMGVRQRAIAPGSPRGSIRSGRDMCGSMKIVTSVR